MVLIISNSNDQSTTKVLEWLNKKNIKWFRINNEDKITLTFTKNDFILKEGNKSIKLSEIKSCWYRRGKINFFNIEFNENYHNGSESFVKEESYHLKNYLYYLLSQKKTVNNYLNVAVNKLIILDICDEIGLKVPKTYILDEKKELSKIKERIITKTISGNPYVKIDNKVRKLFTKRLNNLNLLPKAFYPSLIQEEIEKKYELRIFYLKGDFYSMAIFSQGDEQTKIDFRNYNKTKPNRTVPYKLPKSIELKLDKLMNRIKLNSGSIDMIVTKNIEYFFLEVNPVGQFGMVSYPCNYNLEEEIAKSLI